MMPELYERFASEAISRGALAFNFSQGNTRKKRCFRRATGFFVMKKVFREVPQMKWTVIVSLVLVGAFVTGGASADSDAPPSDDIAARLERLQTEVRLLRQENQKLWGVLKTMAETDPDNRMNEVIPRLREELRTLQQASEKHQGKAAQLEAENKQFASQVQALRVRIAKLEGAASAPADNEPEPEAPPKPKPAATTQPDDATPPTPLAPSATTEPAAPPEPEEPEEPPAPATSVATQPATAGKVKVVVGDLVLVTLGTSDGVKTGSQLVIRRNGLYVAAIRVEVVGVIESTGIVTDKKLQPRVDDEVVPLGQ